MKTIKAMAVDNQPIWVIVPDISLLSYIKSHDINYLDIFYAFGQFGIRKQAEIKDDIELVMKDLNNRIVQLKYFAKEIRHYEKILLNFAEDKKRIYDYKSYQIFLGVFEAYLDKLHSIRDLIIKIDGIFITDFHKEIKKEKWFKLQIGLRHILHHLESPIVTKNSKSISIVCKRIKDVRDWEKYFENWMFDSKGRIHMKLSGQKIEEDLIKFLNKMAKSILMKIDPEKNINIFTGFDKQGNLKSKKYKLWELLKVVDQSKNS